MREFAFIEGRFVPMSLRVVVLVLASDNLGIYAEHEACWRLYAKTNPNVTVYFIRQREDVNETYLDGDTIWSRGREAIETTFDKTVAAFRFIPESSYDYLVRTNLSSVWNFSKLLAFCRTLPKRNVFCGVIGNPGISGAGMILSPDVVATLVQYSNDVERGMWDDIDFGKIAEMRGIPSIPAPRYRPHSRKEVDEQWNRGHHYYLKHVENGVRNVANEIDVMRYLISKIYGLV